MEIYQQLQESGLPNIPSYTTVWRWYTAFENNATTSLKDQPRKGRPKTATTSENIAIVQKTITDFPRQSTRSLADDTGLSRETVRRILTEELGLRKICSTWVPHNLTEQNKQARMQCAQAMINRMDTHSTNDCLKFWATEDETWVLFSTPGMKQDNKTWLAPGTS